MVFTTEEQELPGFLIVDVILTNFVIRKLTIILWWSLWCLENKFLIEHIIGEANSVLAADSLVLGYALCLIIFLSNITILPLCPSLIQKVLTLLLRLLAVLGTLNVWRGVWSLLDQAWLWLGCPFNAASSYLLSISLSCLCLMVTGTLQSLGGDKVVFDTNDSAPFIDIKYWDRKLETEEDTELTKLKQ